ncbi:hypothetical protein [uncultured Tateyamaria sp.]|uniref:hypothetical protein n=1 Tax=uncultured Tateyamaria sp. TaxID=455651 RepID=UPI00262D5C0B|nr:hypothetical protein [uncultured Tateyamaria sp.]
MSFHDPQNPRHQRIFELLRQTDAAVDTTQTLQTRPTRKLDVDEISAVQKTALKSLERSGVSAKPGRYHKFF